MLTLEAFPHSMNAASAAHVKTLITHRHVYSLGKGAHTDILMATTVADEPGKENKRVRFDISASDDGAARAWSIRMHLSPGEKVTNAFIDGVAIGPGRLPALHLEPLTTALAGTFKPFGGSDTRPAPLAGSIVQFHVATGSASRVVEVEVVMA